VKPEGGDTVPNEPIELDQLDREERERILEDLFSENENDCE
jgi:hypothetical protein